MQSNSISTSTAASTKAALVPELYSRQEAAAILKLSVRSVDHLVSRGDLAITAIGGRVLISALELAALVKRQTRRKGKVM
jgi:excisionase family DNA binding protein